MNQMQPIRAADFPCRQKPNLKLFVNRDSDAIAMHRLARCVYAETLAAPLQDVEQLCVMVRNTRRPLDEIAADGFGAAQGPAGRLQRRRAPAVPARFAT
jgi:hypothetical protein